MASMRRVRRDFRKEVLRLVSAGDGNIEKLMEAAGRHFGRDVGYEVLIKSFLQTEVSNSVSYLRSEGVVETIGRKWKLAKDLEPDESVVVSTRRWNRLRGELKAEELFAHNHGLTKQALAAADVLKQVNLVTSEDEQVETPTQEAAG